MLNDISDGDSGINDTICNTTEYMGDKTRSDNA